jgi:hypothetical protein
MIEEKVNLYSKIDLEKIIENARQSLLNPNKINKVGNKFADVVDQDLKNLIIAPFEYLQCGHWYVAYFQHVTTVYPHTDNDTEHMQYVGIIPLYWDVNEDSVATIIHNETNPTKIILPVKNTVTDLITFTWTKNTGVIFSANFFHSSTEYKGVKTGLQIIGYR